MAFGDVIREAASPLTEPTGIGGDANTIWHCDETTDKIYELDAAVAPTEKSLAGELTDSGGLGIKAKITLSSNL